MGLGLITVLIAILFCLALQRFANVGGWFKTLWFESYLKYLSHWLSKLDNRLIILLVIAPVLLLFISLHFIFKEYLFGLFNLVLAIVVLFFCMDARDLKNKLITCFDELEKNNEHAAADAVAGFVGDDSIGDNVSLYREVSRAILLKSFEQVFVNLFWFMVFGIYGVATYFLIVQLRQNALKANPSYIELAKLAANIQNVLEWLPARLLGFSYALVGNFNKGFNYCFKNLWSGLNEVKKFAVDSGLAALDVSSNIADADKSENLSALDVVNRVIIVWLIGFALISIGVWL